MKILFFRSEMMDTINDVKFEEGGTRMVTGSGTFVFIQKSEWDKVPPQVRPRIGDEIVITHSFWREKEPAISQ